MNTRRLQVPMIILASAISALQSAALEPVRSTCIISVCEHTGKLRLRIENGGCGDDGHCGTNLAEEAMDRLTGVSMAYLEHEGAQLTASLTADAGTLVCSGAVHNGSLICDSVFTPNAAFASHMEQMGFSFFFFKQKTAYEITASDWSSDVCSSDLMTCRRTTGWKAEASINPPEAVS